METSVLFDRHVKDKEIESLSVSDGKNKVLATIVRRFLSVLHDRGVVLNDENYSDNDLIKFYTSDYIETNILIPRIHSVFDNLPMGDKNITKNIIVKHFAGIDEECGQYVNQLLKKNSALLSELAGKTIIIWGVGKFSAKIRKIFVNVTIEAFIDSDPLKQGTFIDGIPVKPPSYLIDCHIPIIICTQFTEEIYKQIEANYPDALPYVSTAPYPCLD